MKRFFIPLAALFSLVAPELTRAAPPIYPGVVPYEQLDTRNFYLGNYPILRIMPFMPKDTPPYLPVDTWSFAINTNLWTLYAYDPPNTTWHQVLGLGGIAVTINPTDTVMPYRVDATTFGDSPWSVPGAGQAYADGANAFLHLDLATGNSSYHTTTPNSTLAIYPQMLMEQVPAMGDTVSTTTMAEGMLVSNPTPSTAAAPENSPSMYWGGSAWSTNGAASTPMAFAAVGVPRNAANIPTAYWSLFSSVSNRPPTLEFTVKEGSGYTGGGTKVLTDNGTYQTAGTIGLTINPTTGYVPFKSGAAAFGDSPLERVATGSATNVYIHGNGMVATLNGTDLAAFGITVGGNAFVGTTNGGNAIDLFNTTYANSIIPHDDAFWSLGALHNATGNWLYEVAKTNIVSAYDDSVTATNYVWMSTSMNGPLAIFNLQARTNDVNGPITGFSFRTNGVEILSIVGPGGGGGLLSQLLWTNSPTGGGSLTASSNVIASLPTGLDGATLLTTEDVFAVGEYAGQNMVSSQSTNIYNIGRFSGQNMITTNGWFILNLGEEAGLDSLVLDSTDIFNFGLDPGESSVITNGSWMVINIGEVSGKDMTLDATSDVFNYGLGAGVGMSAASSLAVFNLGWTTGESMELSNSVAIFNIGDWAGRNGVSVLQNAQDIFNYGHDAGAYQNPQNSTNLFNYGLSAGGAQFVQTVNNYYNYGSDSGYMGVGLASNSEELYNYGAWAGASLAGAVADGTFVNFTNVYNYGPEAGMQIKGTNATYVLNYGYRAGEQSTMTGVSDLYNYGSDSGFQSIYDTSATDIYNYGTSAGKGASYTNAFFILNSGNSAGQSMVAQDSSSIVNLGSYAGANMVATNSTDLVNIGSYAGNLSALTNSTHVYTWGYQAGRLLAGDGYTNIYLLGDNAQPTRKTNEFVFGGVNYLYTFPGLDGVHADHFVSTNNVLAFGADPTGVADSTAAIQAALNKAGYVIIPRGTYLVGSLAIPSSTTVISEKATLKMAVNGVYDNGCLAFTNTTDIQILGDLTIDGNYAAQSIQCHGVTIHNDTSRLYFENLAIFDCFGDGVFFFSTGTPTDIHFGRLITYRCNRNNISISAGSRLRFDDVLTHSARAGILGCGIDIEPNVSTDFLRNLSFGNVVTYSNAGPGIQVVGKMSGTNWVHGSIGFGDVTTYKNSTGLFMRWVENVTVPQLNCYSNTVGVLLEDDIRNVTISGGTSHNNAGVGIYLLSGSSQTNGLYNVNLTMDVYDSTGFGVFLENTGGKMTRDVSFTGGIFDDQAIPTQTYGLVTTAGVTNTTAILHRLYGNSTADIYDAGTATRIFKPDGSIITGNSRILVDSAGNVAAPSLTSTNSATFKAGFTSDSGTITNALTANRALLKGGVQDGYTNVLTSATGKDFFYVSVPNTNGIGGHVVYTVFATDGTDVQEISGDVKFAAVAKSTTVTASTADVQAPAVVTGGSTLTAALAANVATNNVFALGVTATTSLTTTNLTLRWRLETPNTMTVNAIP